MFKILRKNSGISEKTENCQVQQQKRYYAY